MWTQIVLAFSLIHVVNLADVTYYEILGVSKQATAQDIRKAYKKLAVKYHPDKNPGSEEQEKFLKVREAYETLKDTEKRYHYDHDSHTPYMKKFGSNYQEEYNNLFYNGLYHGDPFVISVAGTDGFEDFMQDGFHFLKFYSPFCPPCRKMVDTWKRVAEVFKGIVRVGAVNCAYHTAFCYNSLKLNGYPSFIFYPIGKYGSFRYYQFERTFEAMEEYLMKYVKDKTNVDVVSTGATVDHDAEPIAYIVPSIGIDDNAVARIAFHLNGLVGIAMVDDDKLWNKLSEDDYVTVVYKYRKTTKYIYSDVEKVILDELVQALPEIEPVGPEEVKKIRTELRNGSKIPLVLFFSNQTSTDRLPLYQMRKSFRLMQFGEIECSKWPELCSSLQVEEAPAWGVFKPGGAYQRVLGDPKIDVPMAARAVRLHSLSPADFKRIVAGDSGLWVLLVAPHKKSWDHMALHFIKASMHFPEKDDISFGIMACTEATDDLCRAIARQPVIVVQDGARRHPLDEQVHERTIVDFIYLLRETSDIDVTEQQVFEVLSESSRPYVWLVAFMPADCTRPCDVLMKELRLVAKKLRPLGSVRVNVLQCKQPASGLCANVRTPTARLYPQTSSYHYTVSLQHLSQAPYILEWALGFIDDSVQKLSWQAFNKHVAAEELNPKSGKKPWLVYFHSPNCYRCYEMYPDFAMAGILLKLSVKLGRVNCISDRGLCQKEQILRYPTLKMYLGRIQYHSSSTSFEVPLKDFESMVREIKPYVTKYNSDLLKAFNKRKHDEF